MNFDTLINTDSMRNKIIFTIIYFLVCVSVWADAPLRVSSLKQIPSLESVALRNLQGSFEHAQICPLDRNIISFELRTNTGVKLYWYNTLRDSLVEINPPEAEKGGKGIFEEFGMTIKKAAPENYDLDWCPVISPYGEIICVYTHSSGSNQDVYLCYLYENKHVLLTDADKKFKDRNSRWSPDGRMIAFQSDLTGKNDIYLLTGMDKYLNYPNKYKPGLYRVPGDNEIEGSVISWNPHAQTGILTFTEFIDSGMADYYSSSFISLPDSQSVRMMIDYDNNNMIMPSFDPLNGNKVAFYSYKWNEFDNNKKLKKYNININNVVKDSESKISISTISTIPINNSPVIIDDYRGPVWLDNSKYILYLQKNSDGITSLHYGDVTAWENGEEPFNGELLTSDDYKNIRHLSIENQQIVFVSDVNESSYIIIGRLTGEGAMPPEKPDYKLEGHPHYADFVNRVGQTSKESLLKKLTLKPVGGKDLIINRPIVGLGISALIFFLTNSGDDDPIAVNMWDDLPDPPNPDN